MSTTMSYVYVCLLMYEEPMADNMCNDSNGNS